MLRALEKMKGAALAVTSTPSALQDRSAINEGGQIQETVGKSNIGVVKLGEVPEVVENLEIAEGLGVGTSGLMLAGGSPRNGSFRLVGFHPDSICGARVGSGSFVCLKARDLCVVKAHKLAGNSLNLPLGKHLGICKVVEMGKEPVSILSDCFVRADRVSVEVLTEWSQTIATAEEWAFRFQTANAMGDHKLLTPEKINLKREEMQEASRFILEDEDELEVSGSWGEVQWSFSPTQTQHLLDVDLERELFSSRSEEAKFAALFDQGTLLAQVVDSASTALMDLKSIQEADSSRIVKAFAKQKLLFKSIALQLGQRPSNLDSATLWGATEALHAGLTHLSNQVAQSTGASGLTQLQATVKNLVSRPELEKTVEDLSIQLKQVFDKLMEDCRTDIQELISFKGEVEQWVTHTTTVISGLPNSNQAEMAKLNTLVLSLEKEVQMLRKNASAAPNTRSQSFVFPSMLGSTSLSAQSGGSNIQAQLDALRQQILDLSLGKDGTVISYGGQTFRSKDDTVAWIKMNHPEAGWDLFLDPLIILFRMGAGGDSSDTFKNFNYQQNAGVHNDDEASAVLSMKQPIPMLFHKGTPVVTRQMEVSPLNLLKKYSDWHDGSGGMKPHLTDLLSASMSHWQEMIQQVFRGNAPMMSLCTTMLTDSHSFLLALFEFVDEQHTQLVTTSKFGASQSWALCAGLLKRVLSDIFLPKLGFASHMKLKDREDTCGTILWASLLCLRQVKRFMKDTIKGHPSIASEYVAFLAIRSGSEKIDSASSAIDALNNKVKLMEKEINSTKAKADTATQKVQDISKTIQALKTKVEKI